MYGPEPQGRWSTRLGPQSYLSLEAGRRYTVVCAFKDFDGDEHPVGETWTFLTHSYIPYHNGLSLFISLDGEQEWQLPLCLIREEQAGIGGDLPRYLQPAPA